MSISLAPRLKAIVDQPHPRFSREGMDRRRAAVAAAVARREVLAQD